jgi:sec-independent protein translocase protein TatA
MGPIGFKELLIILVVVLVVFGAKKLRTIGSDLGAAVKGFKDSVKEGEREDPLKQLQADAPDADFPENAKQRAADKTERNA